MMKPCLPSAPPTHPPLPPDTFLFERQLYQAGALRVAGVDEAGRGPLAGPVVAACVILPREGDHRCFKDSKLLSPRQRSLLFEALQGNGALIGVGLADAREIEQINILQASLLAMQRAMIDCGVHNDGQEPDALLVDGRFQVPVAVSQLTLVKGESKSCSIAAASIIAKVTRDRIMAACHQQYPQYGFLRHQGYPTKEHRQAISHYGPCPLHRRTFRGVREFVDSKASLPAVDQPSLW